MFWSGVYAAFGLFALGFAGIWVFLFFVGQPAMQAIAALPLLLGYLLHRRARVSVALGSESLQIRQGLGPARTIALPSTSNEADDDPYRESEERPRAGAAVRVADDARLEPKTRVTSVLGALIKVTRAAMANAGTYRGAGLRVPEHREPMARLAFRGADGAVHEVVFPVRGKRNEQRMEALIDALGPATQVDRDP